MELKDVGYIVGIVGTAIATFLTTKHNLKEYVRDKIDELKDKIHKQELELREIKSRDEDQQQILKVLKTDVLDKISNIEGLISNQTTQKKSK